MEDLDSPKDWVTLKQQGNINLKQGTLTVHTSSHQGGMVL